MEYSFYEYFEVYEEIIDELMTAAMADYEEEDE